MFKKETIIMLLMLLSVIVLGVLATFIVPKLMGP